jgi:hypothetical protein
MEDFLNFFLSTLLGMEFSDGGWRWVRGGFVGEEVTSGFTQSLSVVTFKIIGLLCYLDGFPVRILAMISGLLKR